jgi:hypothetical protein
VLGVNGGGQGLCSAGRRFNNEHVLGGAKVAQELSYCAPDGRRRRRFLGGRIGERTVTVSRFHQVQLAQVARKRRLGHAHPQVRELAAQFILARDVLAGEDLQNLTVSKSFLSAHSHYA